MKLEPVLNKFSEHCNQRKMSPFFVINFSRIDILNTRVSGFITKLKKLSAKCEFENLRDSLIKDIIVCGTNNNAFCERFLTESDLTLSRAIGAGHAAEVTRKHASEILQSQSATDLRRINKLHKPRHQAPIDKSKEIIMKCKFCNGSYPTGKCPAYGKSCLNCNRKVELCG